MEHRGRLGGAAADAAHQDADCVGGRLHHLPLGRVAQRAHEKVLDEQHAELRVAQRGAEARGPAARAALRRGRRPGLARRLGARAAQGDEPHLRTRAHTPRGSSARARFRRRAASAAGTSRASNKVERRWARARASRLRTGSGAPSSPRQRRAASATAASPPCCLQQQSSACRSAAHSSASAALPHSSSV
eukprot:108233-Pleurochrysis_carterae.AAC.1